MSPDPKSFLLTDELHRYLVAHSEPLDPALADLIRRTEALGPVSGMQISPEQGTFMTLLARVIGARSAVEVGTFTGYSSTCVARGLVDDGRLLCCDVNAEWTALARQAWAEAGVEERIELVLAPAVDTLRALPPDRTFDLAFIDADKRSYPVYWEEIVRRLRPGGVVLVDNVLWSGKAAAEPSSDDGDDVVAIRAFNDLVVHDARVTTVMLPIADGLTMAVRG